MELELNINYDSDNSKSSNNSNDTINSNGKRQRKPRNDKGKKRVEPKIKADKIQIYLYGNSYGFKKITDVKKYFEKNITKDEKIKNIVMTDDIKYILLNTYLLRRLCNVINGQDEQSLKRPETRQRYLGDKNLRIIPLL